IITNILLAYVLYINENSKDTTLNDEFIEDVIRLLKNKDIEIDTEIPKTIPSLLSLSVEYEINSPEKLNKDFFNGNGTISSKGEGLVEIKHNNELISIINQKLFIYEAENQGDKYNITSQEEAIEIATDFLQERNISTSDM